MSLSLLVTAGQIPEGFCPSTWQVAMNEFAKILQVQVPETLGFGTFTFGPTEPSVDKRIYPWFKTNEDGTPDDVYVWVDGEWVGFGFSRPPSQSVWDARLTLSSGDPLPAGDVSGSVLFLSPYMGNVISLYTGAKWKTIDFSETSLSASSLLANTNYDVFANLVGSDVELSFGAPWSTGTTRSSALTTQDGVYVLDGDPTKRYVGTIRTTASAGQIEDSVTKRFVYNALAKERRKMFKRESTAGWSYTTASWRLANANSSMRVDFVVGLHQLLSARHTLIRTADTSECFSGVGFDSTTAVDTDSGTTGITNTTYSSYTGTSEPYSAPGHHYFSALEYGAGGSSVFTHTPTGGNPRYGGLYASVLA